MASSSAADGADILFLRVTLLTDPCCTQHRNLNVTTHHLALALTSFAISRVEIRCWENSPVGGNEPRSVFPSPRKEGLATRRGARRICVARAGATCAACRFRACGLHAGRNQPFKSSLLLPYLQLLRFEGSSPHEKTPSFRGWKTHDTFSTAVGKVVRAFFLQLLLLPLPPHPHPPLRFP